MPLPERAAKGVSLESLPDLFDLASESLWSRVTSSPQPHRFNVFYIQDPYGIFFALYNHRDEPWDGPIPDHC